MQVSRSDEPKWSALVPYSTSFYFAMFISFLNVLVSLEHLHALPVA